MTPPAFGRVSQFPPFWVMHTTFASVRIRPDPFNRVASRLAAIGEPSTIATEPISHLSAPILVVPDRMSPSIAVSVRRPTANTCLLRHNGDSPDRCPSPHIEAGGGDSSPSDSVGLDGLGRVTGSTPAGRRSHSTGTANRVLSAAPVLARAPVAAAGEVAATLPLLVRRGALLP